MTPRRPSTELSTERSSTRELFAAPNTFTISAWVKTSSTTGGKIIGLGNSRTIDSAAYDRQIYLDNSGRANFAASPNNTVVTITGTQALNNNQWHLVTGSMGANGMVLYVDGAQVGARPDITSGKVTGGYWRIGGDNLAGAANRPTSGYLSGSIDDVVVFPTASAGRRSATSMWPVVGA